MRNKIYIVLALLGMATFFTACEKDGDQIQMSPSVVAPTLATLPDMAFTRAKGADKLVFGSSAVDPGFTASAVYFLEACAAGTNFASSTQLFSGTSVDKIELSVSDVNQKLLKAFPEDKTSSIDFRVRCVLVVDAGTGAVGTGDKKFEYSSETKNANVKLYGLPRLDLVGSGMTQKLVSPLGNGIYTNYVKMGATPFTLLDNDANKSYGDNGGALKVGGAGINLGAAGWYMLTANTTALTYSGSAYMIGLVGSATPNDWNTPDTKMDYNADEDCWTIVATLKDGQFKFRLNDGWSWNLGGMGASDGSADNYAADGKTVALSQGGKNIGLSQGPGSYTLKLYINESKAVITKN
jgi:hypothetical protein